MLLRFEGFEVVLIADLFFVLDERTNVMLLDEIWRNITPLYISQNP